MLPGVTLLHQLPAIHRQLFSQVFISEQAKHLVCKILWLIGDENILLMFDLQSLSTLGG